MNSENDAPRSIRKLKGAIEEVVVGYSKVLDLLLVAFLCPGHVLIEDVPGVGKTVMAKSLAAASGLKFERIQFTPDLLPSDVTGINIYRPDTGSFRFQPGPVFTNVLLADEINRATPRTQSALLECMQEQQVTVGGETRHFEKPFITIATQNPVEMSGTFPLPAAQMDRFLMRLSLGYPSFSEEMEIVQRIRPDRDPLEVIEPVSDRESIMEMAARAGEVYLSEDLREYIIEVIRKTRQHPEVQLGASPRSSVMLSAACRSLAWIRGRDYVTPEDVQTLAVPVLGHRLTTGQSGLIEKRDARTILNDVLKEVKVPSE